MTKIVTDDKIYAAVRVFMMHGGGVFTSDSVFARGEVLCVESEESDFTVCVRIDGETAIPHTGYSSYRFTIVPDESLRLDIQMVCLAVAAAAVTDGRCTYCGHAGGKHHNHCVTAVAERLYIEMGGA